MKALKDSIGGRSTTNGSQASGSSNIEEELHKSVEELGSLKNEVIQCLEQAKSANKEILNEQDIQNWMEEVSNIGTVGYVASKKKSICVQRFICGSKQSRNLEEDVSKKKAVIADLLARGKKFTSDCFTIDPPGIDIIPLGSFFDFKSRKSSLNTIISGLNDEDVRIIGLWGMGGIGKTVLVKKIGKIAQDDKLFDRVVFATVSQTPNIWNIQGAIADMLGLQLKKLSAEDRTTKLREGISNFRKILIILDDVWEKIHLGNIGIPSQSDHLGCKIIVTTRRLEVCHHMHSELEVCLDHLEYNEAWSLFRKFAGLNVFHDNLRKSIVDQCGGLPLAIAVVGSSLRGRESAEEYKDALKKLERSDFVNVESADEEIYHLLKVSYDYLEDEETKKIFLLCSFYPEDSHINLETLTRCAFGLRLFENIDSVSEAREKMVVSIKRLLNASLLSSIQYSCTYEYGTSIFNAFFDSLLPNIDNDQNTMIVVTMHDVIRDVALWITKANGAPFIMPTSQELQRNYLSGNATACYLKINSDCDHIPLEFDYPNLKLLMIDSDDKFINYRDNFVEFTTALQVFLANCFWLLPISLGSLNNLITLRLNVEDARNLCIIGKLKNLEILQLRGYSNDVGLPEEIRELCNLRLLDVSHWNWLERISCNVLSRLTRLEEFYVSSPICIGDDDGEAHCIVDPTVLKFLPRLTFFSGRFSGVKSLSHDLGKLQIFNIIFSDKKRWFNGSWFIKHPSGTRNLELDYLDGKSVKFFEQLLPSLEYLGIHKSMEGISNMVPRLDDTGFKNLTQLRLKGCTDLEYLIDNTGLPSPTSQVLPNLAEIELIEMPQLRKMCNGPPPPNCLGKVKVACINNCPMLGNVIPDLLPVGPQLERLQIQYCDGLKNVYDVPIQLFQHAKHDLPLLCPKIMELNCLKKLKSIWKLPDQLERQELIEEQIELELCTKILEALFSSFNSLHKMKIRECNELEEIFTVIEFNHRKYNGLLSELVKLELVNLPKLKYILKGPQQAYSLNKLTRIQLYECNGLTILFTSTSARGLEKLQCLKLGKCRALETIIKLDDPFEQMSFLEIKEIHIHSCDKLESVLPISFFIGDRLPKLESMFIQKCGQFEQVFGDGEVNVAEVGLNRVIEMEKLQSLTLVDLPRLVRLLPENYNLNFPSLSRLEVDTWFITKLVFKHAGHLISTGEDQILQEERPILQPLSLRAANTLAENPLAPPQFAKRKVDWYDQAGVFLDLSEVVDESLNESSKHIFFQGSVTSVLCLPVDLSEFTSFNKLQAVSIDRCDMLRSLFTLSMLRALPELRVLKIRACHKLEHIVDTNDEDYSTVSESASFPRLDCIFIEYCHNLRSIWPLSLVEALSCLQKLQVMEAGKLEYIISDDIRNGNDCREFEVIKLPKLQTLEIYDVRSLSFVSEREVMTQRWHKSNGLLPIQALQSFMDMEKLVLKFFETVHGVFDLEAAQQPVLTKLEELKLEQFPDLLYIWKGPTRFISLSNLREIEASYCGAIKSLFPQRVAQTLNSLTIVRLRNCEKLEHIIEPGDLEDESVTSGPVTLSNLREITVKNCMVLQSLFPQRVAQTLNSLTTITVRFCKELEHIIEPGDLEDESVSSGPVTLSNLKEIVVEDSMVLQSLLTFSIAQTLWSLKAVIVRNCEKLESIIEPGALEEFEQVETCFPLLENLTASNCKNLQTVFPLSLVSALPELKLLEINSCPMLETIFQDDIGEQRNSTNLEQIQLPSLTALNLIGLPSLRSIAPPSYRVLICSSLKKLCLLDTKDQEEGTPLQGQICKISNGILPLRVLNIDAEIEIENFDAEEVFNLEDCKDGQTNLAQLKKLRLSCLPCLKCIWKGSTNSMYLWSLRHITVNNCITLESSLFTHKMARTLQFLEIIEVYNCNELENIFEPDYAEDHVQVGSLSCLSKLERITVEGCEKLRTIFLLSVAQRFPSLQEVSVKRASKLEQLFIEDREGFAADNKDITLPKLTIIHLEKLPCLIRICPTSCALSCPKFLLLNRMAIGYCHVEVMHNLGKNIFVRNCQHFLPSFRSLSHLINFSRLCHIIVNDSMTLPKNLFTHNMVQRLQSLETLEVFNCKELVNIFEPTNDHEAAASQSVIQLKYTSAALPNLRTLLVQGCDQLQTIFPLSIARSLPKLETVYVKGARQLEKIFSEDKEENEGHRIIKLPELRLVHLEELPSLSHIWPANYHLNCSSFALELKRCVIREPEKLMYLPSLDVESCALEVLFDFEQIPAPNQMNVLRNLRYLCLAHLPNLTCIWKGPTELFCLQRLRSLIVTNCMALRNGLFSRTLAQTLCLLETLQVVNCKELLNLIEPSVSPGNSLCFPRLVYLQVEGCDRLRSIFPVSVTFRLPRLQRMIIKRAQLLEEIFAADTRVEGYKTLIELPELMTMHLEQLPCLYSICPAGYSLSCRPSSVNLEIRNCLSLDIIKYFPKHSVSTNSSKAAAAKNLAKWIPPRPGFVALNTAGFLKSTQDSIYAGCGGLLRGACGNWIRGFSYHVSVSSAIEAELQAIIEGLKMATYIGYKKVVIQTSSESVIQLLKGPPNHLHPLHNLISDCQRYYSSRDWYVELKHIEDEANEAAYWLAFFAFSLKADEVHFFHRIPDGLYPLLSRNSGQNDPSTSKNYRSNFAGL